MLQLLLGALRYGESYADKLSWWERRAMEAVPILALCIIVFAIGAIWGLLARMANRRKEKRTRMHQDGRTQGRGYHNTPCKRGL